MAFHLKSSMEKMFHQETTPAKLVKAERPTKKTPPAKPYVKKGGKSTGSMKDYAHGSQERADEYAARGWAQDATSKVKKKTGKGVAVSVMNDPGVQDPTVENKPSGVTEGTKVANTKSTKSEKITERADAKVDKIAARGDKRVAGINKRKDAKKARIAARSANKEARVAGREAKVSAREEAKSKIKAARGR